MEENISDWSQIMEVTEATVSEINSDWLKNIDQSEVIFELFNKFFHKCGQWGYGFDTFDKTFNNQIQIFYFRTLSESSISGSGKYRHYAKRKNIN